MLRKLLRAKIHRARVTGADLNYEGSIRLPKDLMKAGDFLPHEAVCIWDITNGARFETYVLEGGENDGIITINGAAAHLAQTNDLIIVASFFYLPYEEAVLYSPKVVFVDHNNSVKELRPEKY